MLLAEGWTPEEILVDKTGEEMLLEADASEIPVHLGQSLWADRDPRGQADRLEYASSFRGLAGYNMADTSALYDREKVAQGELAFRDGLTEELGKAIEKSGVKALASKPRFFASDIDGREILRPSWSNK